MELFTEQYTHYHCLEQRAAWHFVAANAAAESLNVELEWETDWTERALSAPHSG